MSERSPSNSHPGLTLRSSISPECNGTRKPGVSVSCTIGNKYTIFECGPIQNQSDNEEISRFPEIAVSGNNVYVVWADTNSITGFIDLFFKRSIL